MPTLAEPGDVAPGQFGPIRRAPARRTASTDRDHVEGRDALGDAEDRRDPRVGGFQDRVRRAGCRDEDARRVGAGLADGVDHGVEDRHGAVERVWPPLPGVIPATIRVPYSSIARLWKSPSRPVMPWTTRRVSGPMRTLMRHAPRDAATALAAASSSDAAVVNRASSSRTAASAAFVPTIRTTIGTSRVCMRARLDQAAGDLVAAGDAAEDVDEDRIDLRVVEDDPHRGRDLVGPRATADVEEVGRLAAGPLDEIHRRHRKPGAVDHAADRPVELDEREAGLARLTVGRRLLVGIAQGPRGPDGGRAPSRRG